MDTDPRQAGTEITDEMISKGIAAVTEFEDTDGMVWIARIPAMVEAILRAGLSVKTGPQAERLGPQEIDVE